METIKIEILELKSIISEMKISVGQNRRLGTAGEKINAVEHM